MTAPGQIILCSVCGMESPLKRTPKYEGFTKIGECLACASCGHIFASEAEVPFKSPRKPRIFSDADAPKAVRVFSDEEKGRSCRHCRHYIVNPFTQRCALHKKEVQATDFCDSFERPAPPPAGENAGTP